MEARAVCHASWQTSSSPAAVSRQQLIQGDRQIADADAGGMIDGVGDGRGGADDPDLANALHAYGSSTLSSCSAIDSPHVIPPRNCERAVFGLMM